MQENARLNAEVDLWKLRSDNWQKFCQLTRPEMTDELNRLKAEVERLTERNQHLEQIDSYLQSANLNAEEQRSFELEAQVERLTKAGDNLARVCRGIYGGLPLWEEWNAAKGVQS
jgi:DNA repair exonuclease SbcCD ATPase subunit